MSSHLPVPEILGRRMQLGMVVSDIGVAVDFWVDRLGIGPWVVVEDALMDRQLVHRGRLTSARMTVAFTYAGDTQLELIAPTDDAPSPYREFLAEGREGVHHLGFWPDDYGASCAALERAGFEELSRIDAPDGTPNVSYYTAPPVVGIIVEIVPMTPLRRATFTGVENLVRTWDGSRPVRRHRTRADFIASPDFLAEPGNRGSE
jgi:catechol 2,3-dioxygenase-like lactoylglutathione lyase family enzyme